MAQGMGGSTVANLVAQRQKLSAVRQRIGLEGASAGAPQANMQPVGPAANTPAPAAVVGPQAQAVMGPPDQGGLMMRPHAPDQQATIQPPAEGQPFDYQHPTEAKSQMMAMVQNFLDQHGEQQQGLIDQQRQAQQTTQTAGGPPPRISPIAKFYQSMGRLPTPQELVVLAVQNGLQAQLGRAPSRGELTAALKSPQTATPPPPPTPEETAPPAGGPAQ